jgi:hypothetical protein
MSLKLNFLHSHFDFFPPENVGAVCDECGERSHQDISQIEKRYSVKWSLIRQSPTGEYKRHKKNRVGINAFFSN